MLRTLSFLLCATALTACSSAPRPQAQVISPAFSKDYAPAAPTHRMSKKQKHHHFPMHLHSTTPQNHKIHGIDISKYQGEIDWNAVRQDNISFAYIKATEGGDRVDEKFKQNWQNAKDAGLPRGAYHFAYWCRPMSEQADWFIQNVPYDRDALPPVLDVEWNFESPSCPKKVPKEFAIKEMHVFLDKLERHYGKKPVIYADIPFHRDVLEQGEFSEYAFWVRSVKYPIQEKYPNRQWSFWQYTASGKVAGINAKVDKNVFAGSETQWQKLVATKFIAPDEGNTRFAEAPVQPVEKTEELPKLILSKKD